MRKLPHPPPVPGLPVKESQCFSVSVCTPLFGGGVEAGKNDPVTVIRGASIRGHLRFWWRATRGARFLNVSELKRAETAIWGAADTPSAVNIHVEIVNQGTSKQCAFFPQGSNFPRFNQDFPPYALFPFAGNINEGKSPGSAAVGVAFKLTISCQREILTKEVVPAVWAWVNFGGIGARPRRGCGALFCEELAPKGDTRAWYREQLKLYSIVPAAAALPWPTLPGPDGVVFQNRLTLPVSAWSQAVGMLKKFRQEPGCGRNPGQQPNRPGRSRWPEADSLRRWTQRSAPMHKDPITAAQNAFPRAEFGMPIIFHFKDKGDPGHPDAQLVPASGGDRMSSPLILRPLCVSLTQAYPMFLRLKTEEISEALVKKGEDILELNSSALRRPDLASYRNSPMSGLSQRGSALEAFMAFAIREGYQSCI